jgi:WD40-like Beta Propeller Repeat
MHFADLRIPAGLGACAVLVALVPAIGGASGTPVVGHVTVNATKTTITNVPKSSEGQRFPLHALDRITLDPHGNVDFVVKGVKCHLWSERSNGNVQVEPKAGVGIAFDGGTTTCHTSEAQARQEWQSYVKHGARLNFKDPLFTVVVGRGTSLVRVARGVVVVTGANGPKNGVVVGNNQQTSVASGSDPTAATAATGQTAQETASVKKAEQSLPPPTDTTAPVTHWTQPPPVVSSFRAATFWFASDHGVTFSCSFDGSVFRLCSSPQTTPPQPPGTVHTFAVLATDAAGNVEKTPLVDKWEIDNSKIAFMSTRSGDEDIWVMDPVPDPSSTSAVDLTKSPATNDADPSWSRDGTQIAYERQSIKGGPWSIWVMNADGSSPHQITQGTASNTNPTWSPDGKQIAYESDATGNRQIYVINSDGSGKPQQLTTTPGLPGNANFDPAWSPVSGGKIAFASTRTGGYGIYTMNADGTEQTPLPTPGGTQFGPSWSPDGTKIAYLSDANRSSKQIYVEDVDATAPPKGPVVNSASDDANPSWAPHGAAIVYQSGPMGGTDLWLVDVGGTGPPTQITFSPGDDEVPDWGAGG